MDDHLDAHLGAAPMQAGPGGPLRGLRILDVTHAAAGPFATLMLADLGAEVIKVEPPTGELVRFAAPFTLDDESQAYGGRFANRNRNKRSIALDFTDPADREVFLSLVATADGLVENLRTGVMDRHGVGWDACHARHPRLVYAAIRGFGDPRTGASPYAEWPAFDVVAQAMGGLVAATGPDPDHPTRVGITVGDYVPGLLGALGLVSAILHGRESGQGQFVDVAMVDGLMSLCETSQMVWSYTGRDLLPTGNTVDGVTPFGIYPTADGHCAIAAPTDSHWALLCAAMGREDLIVDERTASGRSRGRHRELVDGAIESWSRSLTSKEVVGALGGAVSVAPVFNARDWADDPHVRAREMLVRVEHPHHRPTVQLGCPIKFTETPAGVYRRPPLLDEDGPALRAELSGPAVRWETEQNPDDLEVFDLPLGPTTAQDLMTEIFTDHWASVRFGPLIQGGVFELRATAPPRLSMLDGYLTVDTGGSHFHLCVGEHRGSPEHPVPADIARRRRCARVELQRQWIEGAPRTWMLRLFNGEGAQMITVLLPNPFLDDDMGILDPPDWSRLALWDHLRSTYRGEGPDPADRSGDGFLHP